MNKWQESRKKYEQTNDNVIFWLMQKFFEH